MARLLISHHGLKNIELGTIMSVREGTHIWGLREDKAVWIKSGRNIDNWPNKLLCIELPDVSACSAEEFFSAGDWRYDEANDRFVHSNGNFVNRLSLANSLKHAHN